MATLDWPAGLPPHPLLSAYSVKADSGIIRTPMDSGLARQRKRFSTPTSRVTVAWQMTGLQTALFKSWLVHRAANGGAWFNMTLRLDDGTRSVEARFTSDANYKLLRRAGSSSPGSELWSVSSEIEIKDEPPYSADVVDILNGIGFEMLLAIRDELDPPYLLPAIEAWFADFGA